MNAKFIRLANWGKFQHYKDRNPPWIKLHQELLTSQAWVSSDDASRSLAIACMLLASRTDNKIPFDPDYLQRVAYLNQTPDFSQLIQAGFIEIVNENGVASTMLASVSTVHTNARPETETEAEAEAEAEKVRAKREKRASRFLAPSLSEVKVYCEERKNGIDAEHFIDHYQSRGWKYKGELVMKDWKAAVRTWEKNGVNGNGNSNRNAEVIRAAAERLGLESA